MSSAISREEKLTLVSETYKRLNSWRAVAKELGMPRSTMRHYQRQLQIQPLPLSGGDQLGLKVEKRDKPEAGQVKRYILTCAQNNTDIHEAAWKNLVALSEYWDAEILVSRFAYNKNAYYQQASSKPGTNTVEDKDLWYDSRLAAYFSDERIQLAPGLVWCGESNISPTAIRPLSGLETYTGRKSAIFPHVKIAMESVASGKTEATKLLYTTGTVTLRNYIQRKAGLKAEFHHSYGALLVEIDSKGRWFCRQLHADDTTGDIYDLELLASSGAVTGGHGVQAVTFGDIHAAQINTETARMGWESKDSMMAILTPRHVFLHDLIDFRARNHHDRGNPHLGFSKFINGEEFIQDELEQAVELVNGMLKWGSSVKVVQSNHDNALMKWLRETDYRQDPANALLFLSCQKRIYEAIGRREEDFHILEWVLRWLDCPEEVKFLRTDESFIICREHQGGIECGMHGHEGPNGSRGSAMGLKKMGRRANIGHSHSAMIIDGVYVCGTSSNLDCGYNTGPSSWSHSHIITYPNGKRAIITMWGGAWRAI